MEQLKEHFNLNVGVRILDRDHRQMAEVIYELKAATLANRDPSLTVPLLRKLAQFTLNHFAFEEDMMQTTRYPGMAVHRLNHRHLMGKLGALIAHHDRGGHPLASSSLRFLHEWHIGHVHSDDLHYGLWLNAMG
jgi:hemerythrin-like metal-binding protein